MLNTDYLYQSVNYMELHAGLRGFLWLYRELGWRAVTFTRRHLVFDLYVLIKIFLAIMLIEFLAQR